MIFIIPLLILAVVVLVCVASIVPQSHEYVIEFLGTYMTTWSAGLHFRIPFVTRIAKKVSLKEQVLDFPPQSVITKDNVSMQIDTVIYLQVVDAKLFAYGVESPLMAIENLTATTLRNIIGEMDLDGTLTGRDTINCKMQGVIDEATDPWGIKVNRVEVKNIIPPAGIQQAMEKQMKAERERREAILLAEGEKKAAILEAQAAKESALLRAQGEAEAIRVVAEARADSYARVKTVMGADGLVKLEALQTLTNMGNGSATTILLPSELQGLGAVFGALRTVVDKMPEQKPEPAAPADDGGDDGSVWG